MNKRQVIILWIIALVLGAAVGTLKLTSKDANASTTKRSPGQTLFESFPATDVVTVELAGAKSTVTLRRKDGAWVVAERGDYPANGTQVNEFIRTVNDLKVTRGIEAGPSFAPRFGMDENASGEEERGITATFKDASGAELAKVSLGKNIEGAQDGGMMGGAMVLGRYIRNHADTTGFYAVSEMFSSVSVEISRWLEDDFISPEKIRSISLTAKGSDAIAWKVVRDTEEAEFKLDAAAPGEVLDTTAASPFKTLFSYARFDDVVPADKVGERADETGKRSAVIETFEGFTYRLVVTPVKGVDDKVMMTVEVSAEIPKERKKAEGEKEEDAKSLDEAFAARSKTLAEKLEREKKLAGRTFELAKTTVEPLLKERDQLIKKAEAAPAGTGTQGTVQSTPGGFVAPPPPEGATQAVTPPIEIPAQPAPSEDGTDE